MEVDGFAQRLEAIEARLADLGHRLRQIDERTVNLGSWVNELDAEVFPLADES